MNFIADAIKGGRKKADPYEEIFTVGKRGIPIVGPEKKETKQGPSGKMKEFIDQRKLGDQIGEGP